MASSSASLSSSSSSLMLGMSRFLARAAEQGNALAQYYLGYCYQNGCEGVEHNQELAHMWYRLSAFQSYKPAFEILEKMGIASLPELVLTNREFYRDAGARVANLARRNLEGDNASLIADAKLRVGMAHYKGMFIPLARGLGRIVKKSKSTGRQLIMLVSRRLDLPAGLFAHGLCSFWGINTRVNPAKAVYYFILSAQHEYELARQYLGYCYYFGRGIARNKGRAQRYLSRYKVKSRALTRSTTSVTENSTSCETLEDFSCKASYENLGKVLGIAISSGVKFTIDYKNFGISRGYDFYMFNYKQYDSFVQGEDGHARQLRGWKFHISLNDEMPGNIAKGWNILKNMLIRDKIEGAKVVLPKVRMAKQPGQAGKQITIYTYYGMERPSAFWERFFIELTRKYVKARVMPGYVCRGNNKKPESNIRGSSYISYRNDKNDNIHVKITIPDPYEHFDFSGVAGQPEPQRSELVTRSANFFSASAHAQEYFDRKDREVAEAEAMRSSLSRQQ